MDWLQILSLVLGLGALGLAVLALLLVRDAHKILDAMERDR